MELLLATRNQHKTGEFRELLADDFEIADLSSFPAIEMPEETGTAFEQNAILKAVSVSKMIDQPVVADDSGLEVDALGGAPGIYSARYSGEHASDAANIDKLLRELKNITKRSARFRCVIALARAGEIAGTFEGVVEGDIVDHPRGTSGFGYDPVFQPAGFDRTFAEMPPGSKNRISHRAKAIAALRKALRPLGS
jgi:XTP/dITP diphosphohydrolase